MKYVHLNDSLYSIERQKQLTEMQAKYETDKKEQQIDILNKDKVIKNKEMEAQNFYFLLLAALMNFWNKG